METKKRGPRARIVALSAFAAMFLAPSGLGAAPSAFGSSTEVDWTAGLLKAEVELDLGVAGIRLPSGRSQADCSLKSAVPDLIRDAALAIALDSYRTVGDSLDDGTLDPARFEAFLETGRMKRSALSRDLGKLQASYEWSLADLAALYVRHSVPVDLPAPNRYVPARVYTGILVFVQGDFAVRGEHRSGALRPCLFPRIYDEFMLTILERNLVYPDALRSWGTAGYASSLDDPVIEARAGDAPLRIMASEIFGSSRTDAIISDEDALRILGSPENRELVRQGKIVFVITAP